MYMYMYTIGNSERNSAKDYGETYKYTYKYTYNFIYKYTYKYIYNYVYRYMYTIGKTNAGKAQLPTVYIIAVGRVETRIWLTAGGILWVFVVLCGTSHSSMINQILLYIYTYTYTYMYIYMYTYMYIIAHRQSKIKFSQLSNFAAA